VPQVSIGCVDDGVYFLLGDVALGDFQSLTTWKGMFSQDGAHLAFPLVVEII
jgi:hypothetical protein